MYIHYYQLNIIQDTDDLLLWQRIYLRLFDQELVVMFRKF